MCYLCRGTLHGTKIHGMAEHQEDQTEDLKAT